MTMCNIYVIGCSLLVEYNVATFNVLNNVIE